MTLRQTLSSIRSDYVKVSTLMKVPLTLPGILFLAFMPSIVALTMYRFSHWFYCKRMRVLAWQLWQLNIYITGTDLMPYSSIGRSCFIGHPVGCGLAGKLGDNVTLYGSFGIGGGRGHGDVGAGDGLPVLGDNVVVGYGAAILGPIRVGDGAVIGAMSLVIEDVGPGTTVAGNPARPVRSGDVVADVQTPRECS